MEKTMRVFTKEREITVDGKKVKVYEHSWTPNGKKFFKIIFEGVSKPNKAGYWIVKVDDSKISPKNGKPMYRKDGTPVISKKTGEHLVENDILFLKETISLKFDEDYEKERAVKQQEKVNAIFSLENADDEELPFQ